MRKEAVDLLGSFVLAKPALAESYYKELLPRLMVLEVFSPMLMFRMLLSL